MAHADQDSHLDQAELSFLLHQRSLLTLAQSENAAFVATLAQAVETDLPSAIAELHRVEQLLNLADELHAHDSQKITLGHAESDAGRQVDRLPLTRPRDHDEELLGLRSLLTTSAWTKGDEVELSRLVLAECMRMAAYHLRQQRSRTNNALIEVTNMSDLVLASYSLPWEDSGSQFDWHSVASQLSSTSHTASDCRTRWLSCLRPGLNHQPWSQEELTRLKAIVEGDPSSRLLGIASKESAAIDWHCVAYEVGTGRQSLQCLRTYQQHFEGPCSARPKAVTANERQAEDEELLHQASLWGLNWAMLSEKLRRPTSSIKKRYQVALDVQLTRGKWKEDEMRRLGAAIADQLQPQSFGSSDNQRGRRARQPSSKSRCTLGPEPGGENAQRSLYHQSLQVSLDWTAIASHVGTRSAAQCREKWVDRPEHVDRLPTQPRHPDQTTSVGGSSVDAASQSGKAKSTRRARMWAEEEDERLLKAMDLSQQQLSDTSPVKGTGGAWTWSQIGEFVGGRNDKQVRDRWTTLRKRRSIREQTDARTITEDIPTGNRPRKKSRIDEAEDDAASPAADHDGHDRSTLDIRDYF
ncbi:unnamed protein product [Parajaminaea phylloscopi]